MWTSARHATSEELCDVLMPEDVTVHCHPSRPKGTCRVSFDGACRVCL